MGEACAIFYKTNVTAGTKSVKLQWFSNAGTAIVDTRALFVTLNVR